MSKLSGLVIRFSCTPCSFSRHHTAFFQDDVISDKELAALFQAIDSDHSEGISPDELTTYFSGQIASAVQEGEGGVAVVDKAFGALRSFSDAYSSE
jgi:hypothetical protein